MHSPANAPTSRVWLLAATALAAVAMNLFAQEITLKSGQKIQAPGASRVGNQIYVTVNSGMGSARIAYDAGQVASIKLPDSPDFNAAIRFLADDKAAEALTSLDRMLPSVEAFHGLGDDRWGQAMLMKSAALLELGREHEARTTLAALVAADPNSSASQVAQMRLASLEDPDPAKADEWLKLAESGIADTNPPYVQAEAWLLKAKVLRDKEDYENALRAALYVTIFFSGERLDVSRALLISGDCYLSLEDKKRGVRAYHDIVVEYPNTASATAAQKEISKGGEAFSVIIKALEEQEKETKKIEAGTSSADTKPASGAASTTTPKP